jgi:hypothetical protein
VRTIELSTASRPLAEYAERLDGGVMVLTWRRKPVAALVSLEHVDAEALSLSGHPEFLALIARAPRQVAAGRRLSLEQMRRAVLSKRPAAGGKLKAPRGRGRSIRARRRA